MNEKVAVVGFWSGVTAFAAAVSYDLAQVLQIVGVLRFPADEIIIYVRCDGIYLTVGH